MLLLGREPFLYTRAPVKNLPADKRPRRAHAEHVPAVESAHVPPKLGGQFFFRKKL
jgi:hypothetical protein